MNRTKIIDKWIWVGMILLIFLSSILLSKDADFIAVSMVGVVVMAGISFLDYNYIEKYSKHGLIGIGVLIVAVIFSSIGTDVCGVRCLCIGEVQLSVVLLSMLLVPLYGAYIASCSSYTEICFCNLYLSLLALTLNFGSFNVWGISVIPGMIVFMTAWEKESFKEKFSKETRLMGLEALTIISLIGSVIIPLWRIRKIIWTFLTKEGEAAYIYDVLQKLQQNSRLLGESFTVDEIISILPEYNTTCILTYYMARFGIIAGVGSVVLVAGTMIKALMDAQNMELGARLIVTGAASNVIWMMLISVLENLQWIPFVARSSFLPFYSSGVGNIFACYILTGLIFNIYRSI